MAYVNEACLMANDRGRGADPVHISSILDQLTHDEMRTMLAQMAGGAPELFEGCLLEAWQWRARMPAIVAQGRAWRTYVDAGNVAAVPA